MSITSVPWWLFQGEPLNFYSTIFFRVWSGGLVPATANGFDALGIELEPFDQHAFHIPRPLLGQLDGFHRHAFDQGLTALFPEFFDPGIVNVATQHDQ